MSRWGMVLNMNRCVGCYACVVACKLENNTRTGVNWNAVSKIEWGNYPDAHQAFRLDICMQCEDAPCISVCPTKAAEKRDDGIVVVDYDKCIKCLLCVPACPYNARKVSDNDVYCFPGYDPAPYELEGVQRMNVVEKCTFCYQRVDQGKEPACVINCPGHARIFGDLDDPSSEINQYIKERNAINVKGTAIYYVLPEGLDLQEVLK